VSWLPLRGTGLTPATVKPAGELALKLAVGRAGREATLEAGAEDPEQAATARSGTDRAATDQATTSRMGQ
jgi:hypothetical protein